MAGFGSGVDPQLRDVFLRPVFNIFAAEFAVSLCGAGGFAGGIGNFRIVEERVKRSLAGNLHEPASDGVFSGSCARSVMGSGVRRSLHLGRSIFVAVWFRAAPVA
jgi:hypothetical protein